MLLRKTQKKNNIRIKKGQFILIGSLILIIGGVGIIGLRCYQYYNQEKAEQKQIDEFIDNQRTISTVGIIETENEDINNIQDIEEKNTDVNNITENYIAVLEIPKINLKKGLFSIGSDKNDVNRNIEIMSESDMPDVINGNFILAGHSGTSKISYFRNLNKLEKDDVAYIYYNGGRFLYKLVNSYEIQKTGEASISRNGKKTTLTLITCKHNTDKQVVYIFELMKDGE